jgi:hypothetical protein
MSNNANQDQKTYYVANLSTYALVEAGTAEEAKAKGEEKLGKPATVVRFATTAEIDLQEFHARMTRQWATPKED